ncbi:MAG: HAD family hydrolase, partial [Bacilli bacterium]
EEKNYLQSKDDIILLSGVVNGLKRLQARGYLLFIVSNQSGIARGFFDEKKVQELNDYLLKTLQSEGVIIEKIYYCPHHKDGVIKEYAIDCECRKPKTGMIKKILNDYSIDLKTSFFIGDKMTDVELGNNCNSNSILVLTGYGKKEVEKGNNLSFTVASDLSDAADQIIGKNNS